MQMAEEFQTTAVSESRILPWLVCITASLFFFYQFIQGNIFASIANHVMEDFRVGADKMAWLSSIYYVANVMFLLVAGFILDHYSTKRTILLAMALCVASTFLFAHTHSFFLALVCRFAAGIGSAFCFLGPVRLASRWFPPIKMAMITGVIVTFAMTGGMMAQYPLTKLMNQVGWRYALVYTGWLGIILFGIMAVGILEKPVNKAVELDKSHALLNPLWKACFNRQTLCAAFYTSLMNMAIAIFGAMMGSLYLMQRLAIGNEEASFINMFLFLGAIVGGPIIGFISDKLSLRLTPMKFSAVLALFVMLAALYMPMTVLSMKIAFFLLGFFTAGQVISYALVAESSPPNRIASALSVVSIATQGGYILYQNVFGYLLAWQDKGQAIQNPPIYSLADYHFAAIILPIGLMIAFIIVFGLKESFSRHLDP